MGQIDSLFGGTENVRQGGMADRVIRMQSGRIAHEQRNETKIRPDAIEW